MDTLLKLRYLLTSPSPLIKMEFIPKLYSIAHINDLEFLIEEHINKVKVEVANISEILERYIHERIISENDLVCLDKRNTRQILFIYHSFLMIDFGRNKTSGNETNDKSNGYYYYIYTFFLR